MFPGTIYLSFKLVNRTFSIPSGEIIKAMMNGEEESSRCERWKQSTKALLSGVSQETWQLYNIPVVPDNLWKSNESAYIPKLVSIGPQYRGRRELLQMEEFKWRCITTLLSRTIGLDAIEKCLEVVLKLDATVRASYVDKITLDRYDLATTMVFDGCFMLELLICESQIDLDLPIPFNGISPGIEVKRMEYVMSDLLLVDNQIPLYILEILFQNTLGDSPQLGELIQNLALPVFGLSGGLMVKSTFHFLDIVYSYMEMRWIAKKIEHNDIVIDIDTKSPIKGTYQNLNRCATRLKAVGITIQQLHIDKNFMSTTEYDKSKRILKIPELIIEHTTEASWRSFIAWEHHKKLKIGYSSVTDRHSTCSSSALLFSDLICCSSDVQLLKDKGIIVDKLLKSNIDLVAYFHSIAKGVDRDIIDPNHASMFIALNTSPTANYATKILVLLPHWSNFAPTLRGYNYVQQFLKSGYNFAATFLSCLTVVQTCYSILAYHYPKKD